jgi:hypothetical protein
VRGLPEVRIRKSEVRREEASTGRFRFLISVFRFPKPPSPRPSPHLRGGEGEGLGPAESPNYFAGFKTVFDAAVFGICSMTSSFTGALVLLMP